MPIILTDSAQKACIATDKAIEVLIQLIYVSAASHPMEEADLLALLKTARQNNSRDDVTGILVYSEGNFLQILEGEPDSVHATFSRILRDTRHGGILVLAERQIARRDFPSWAMGFRNVPSDKPEGLVDLFDSEGVARESVAGKLLKSFRRQQMREFELRR